MGLFGFGRKKEKEVSQHAAVQSEPVKAQPSEQPLAKASEPHWNKKVLIATKTAFMGITVESIVKREHYDPFVVNGKDAVVGKYEEIKPDLVLLDIDLATSTIGAIKAIDRDAKIILLTDKGNEALLIDLLKMGANDYIFKPIDEALLIEVAGKQFDKDLEISQFNGTYTGPQEDNTITITVEAITNTLLHIQKSEPVYYGDAVDALARIEPLSDDELSFIYYDDRGSSTWVYFEDIEDTKYFVNADDYFARKSASR